MGSSGNVLFVRLNGRFMISHVEVVLCYVSGPLFL